MDCKHFHVWLLIYKFDLFVKKKLEVLSTCGVYLTLYYRYKENVNTEIYCLMNFRRKWKKKLFSWTHFIVFIFLNKNFVHGENKWILLLSLLLYWTARHSLSRTLCKSSMSVQSFSSSRMTTLRMQPLNESRLNSVPLGAVSVEMKIVELKKKTMFSCNASVCLINEMEIFGGSESQ